MRLPFDWKKALLWTANVMMTVYLVLAITAFNVPADVRNHQVCTHVMIDIEKDMSEGFLTPDEVKAFLQRQSIYPLARKMTDVNIRAIEETLRAHQLVEWAECHKAQRGHICIKLKQRIPVVRVQPNDGKDYYVSNKGVILAPSGYSIDVVVATGDITEDYAKTVLAPMAATITTDKFWNRQIVQLNVLPDHTVEMVPRVGDNILYIGEAAGIEKKLERLKLFYLYGLSQAGWNKYSRISVEYDNQIICKKKKQNKK